MTGQIFTIGFTEKSAERFFSLLEISGSGKLVDVRLNTKSQLAGFAKQADLAFFLKKICRMDYIHAIDLAPTKSLLDAYKKNKQMTWEQYEAEFKNLLVKRSVDKKFSPEDLGNACLLCSEHKPHNCHRRIVAEYLNTEWGTDIRIKHLV